MSTLERKTVHVSDATGRIAMLEQRTLGTDPAPKELIRFIYSNSIQSANLELDLTGKIISYEEYHPFGTTSYQATNASINAVAKRYRYTGKERDEESGLYYHGARYYIPWLARWSQCDPIGIKDGLNVYAYCSNNPVMLHDPSGMSGEGERIEYSKNPEGKIEGKIDTVVITPNKTELTTDNVNVNQGKELDPSMFSNTGGFGSMALQDENTSSAALIPMNYHKNLIAEQAIYVREQQKITQCIQENQSVLFEDGSGGTVGEIKKAQGQSNLQGLENVRGGFFGSATYLIGYFSGSHEQGVSWSNFGAVLDQGAAAMAVQRPNFQTQTSTNAPKFEQTTSVLQRNVYSSNNRTTIGVYTNTKSVDFVAGVKVERFGTFIGEGIINVKPTIEAIENGSLKLYNYGNNEQHPQLNGKPFGYWQKPASMIGYGKNSPLRIIRGQQGEYFLSPDHFTIKGNLIPLNH